MKARILVVDDEPDAVELIKYHLDAAGYRVVTAADGREAMQRVQVSVPDLIILDWMLPELDGLEVCKRLKQDPGTASIPVVMLTAKATEMDRVLGLEIGADDYITKPFSPRELILRVQKQLRQPVAEPLRPLQFGSVVIDTQMERVTVDGSAVELTRTEYRLLLTLAERRGRLQSRDQLLKDVWEYEVGIDSRTVDTHMRRLRVKLGDSARFLETIRGFGYRLLEES